MGRIFLAEIHHAAAQPTTTQKHYKCKKCHTDLASQNHLLSRQFQARLGKGYLFSKVLNLNIHKAPIQQRDLISGRHLVADVYCLKCDTLLGWRYVAAKENDQGYKVGKVILEKERLVLAVFSRRGQLSAGATGDASSNTMHASSENAATMMDDDDDDKLYTIQENFEEEDEESQEDDDSRESDNDYIMDDAMHSHGPTHYQTGLANDYDFDDSIDTEDIEEENPSSSSSQEQRQLSTRFLDRLLSGGRVSFSDRRTQRTHESSEDEMRNRPVAMSSNSSAGRLSSLIRAHGLLHGASESRQEDGEGSTRADRILRGRAASLRLQNRATAHNSNRDNTTSLRDAPSDLYRDAASLREDINRLYGSALRSTANASRSGGEEGSFWTGDSGDEF